MKKLLLNLFLLCFVLQVPAQKKVIIEQFRCISSIGPVMNYWKSTQVQEQVVKQLSKSLLQYQQLLLPDTANLHIQLLKNSQGINTIKPEFKDSDTTHLHLYIDLFELDPGNYFSYIKYDPKDSLIQKRSTSIFVLKVWIANYKKDIVFVDALAISVIPSKTNKIGNSYLNSIRFNTLVTTPLGFAEIVKKGIVLLFNPDNTLQLIEVSAPPAFVGDNYLITKTIKQHDIITVVKNDISSYEYNKNREMIRMGEPLYEEIQLKAKTPVVYPELLLKALKKANNYSNSTFLFLRQDARDVIRDKNYFIKLTSQIDPLYQAGSNNFPFTNFLSGNFHYLISEKDTLADFSIQKNVADETGKKIYPNMVSNGFDSSFFLLNDMKTQPEWPVVYNYVVTGNIGKHDFSILYGGISVKIKEVYLDKKLVCITEGKNGPEKLIVFDNTLKPELLNQLLFIAFIRFFE
jgi:hypothetical protein